MQTLHAPGIDESDKSGGGGVPQRTLQKRRKLLQVTKASLLNSLVLIQVDEGDGGTADPERVIDDDEEEERKAPLLMRSPGSAEEKA